MNIVDAAGHKGSLVNVNYLNNLLVTYADMDGKPYEINVFPQYVPGSNGPVYLVANVPVGTEMSSLEITTSYTPEQKLDINYRNNLPPEPGCTTGCPWKGITRPSPAIVAAMSQYFSYQH